MACDECCRNCQLLHGKNKDLSPSVSRFVKIVIGDDVSNLLWVPPMYTKTISNWVGKDAKLEDSTGAQWTVSLSNYKGVLAFHKGWAKFAADHKLQLGDILVFNYLNSGHFVVHIFVRTLVERTEFANNSHQGNNTLTSEKNVVDTTQSQRNATNGVSFRSIDHSSRQARPGRNLINAKTISEMGVGDNGFIHTEKTAADTTPFQGNATEGVSYRNVGRQQGRTSLEMGDRDNGAIKGVSFRKVGRPPKQARTSLEMGDGNNGGSKSVSFMNAGRPSKQARTSLEIGDGDNGVPDIEKIAADSSPFEGNATNGVCFKIGRPSKQARTDRNLDDANTSLEMGDGDNGASDIEKIAADTSPFEGNATKGVCFKIGRPSIQARTDRNLDDANTSLEMGGGDFTTANTSELNQESSRTSFPIESNFETPLDQPSTCYTPLQPKSGNGEQPCLDDAFCVIIDRSTYYAETEKKVVLDDLSVYERQNREPISDRTCIDRDEATYTLAQKFEASMAEANSSGAGFINCMTVSKVPENGMVQGTKASGHMDTTGNCSKTPLGTGNCNNSPLGTGNCSKSPLGNVFTLPIPRQVHTMDTHKEIKVAKKEQVTFREEASDHLQKLQGLKPSLIRRGEGPSTSSLKRKAPKSEPDESFDEDALFPITCSAGTDNCDYIKLPARLPSVAFKKGRGRIDDRCSILLIDPEKRKWPAIYIDKFGSFFGVICGWKQFNEANKVRPGDSYVFTLDNKSECKFKVDVVRM